MIQISAPLKITWLVSILFEIDLKKKVCRSVLEAVFVMVDIVT